MIYEHIRATGAYGAEQGLSDLFSTSENYRTLFGFRLSWLCTVKKLFETMDRQVVYD